MIKTIDNSAKEDAKTPNKIAKNITVLEAKHIMAALSVKVTAQCIENCWRNVEDEDEGDVKLPSVGN